MTLVVCTGTGTEIGKTWVGAAVLSRLRERGLRVAARKPVQSFDPADAGPTDADVLASASGEHPHDVCPEGRWYPVAMAPPMAAAVLERAPFSLDELLHDVRWPDPEPDVRWIETVGGVRAPIAFDADSVDVCHHVEPDLTVLVADAGLGTINAVRLSAEAIDPWPFVVYLNHWTGDELHTLNRAWLADRDGFDVVVSPDELAGRLG
ncbi:MAG TPA: dethiobiotin synthase [Acidimicrobiales bacterium]|nr:dethiobiotin synthase [Acidimicrobiales bacterium]